MFDPITLAVGGGLLAVGWITGRIGRRRKPEQSAPQAVCGCGHPLALHDRDTNECRGKTDRPYYMEDGTRNGREWVDCTCRQYDGPKPIEEMFAPKYLPPTD